jgi:hypothetical protein
LYAVPEISFRRGSHFIIRGGSDGKYLYPPTTYSAYVGDHANPAYVGSNAPIYLDSVNYVWQIDSNDNAATTPLPSTACAGLGLLGGLGCWMLARRRKVVAE